MSFALRATLIATFDVILREHPIALHLRQPPATPNAAVLSINSWFL